MLPKVNQFFDTLPQKHCCKCGSAMEELSECYTHICQECSRDSVYPLSFKPDPKYSPQARYTS
ncbi:protein YhfH [Paenibacillus hodogayensis]|uniref:Protein YhfH n=1 Tax=Paenibacillus hodogayensis TaxID=279208 RepID=A0ABV5W3V1_9BACL